MGRVLVTALVENLDDLFAAGKGLIPEGKIRRSEVTDALVDTGATGLLVPRRLIEQLGLEPLRVRTARTIAGQVPLHVYRAVRLTIQRRDCISDVSRGPGRLLHHHRPGPPGVDGLSRRCPRPAPRRQSRPWRRTHDRSLRRSKVAKPRIRPRRQTPRRLQRAPTAPTSIPRGRPRTRRRCAHRSAVALRRGEKMGRPSSGTTRGHRRRS